VTAIETREEDNDFAYVAPNRHDKDHDQL